MENPKRCESLNSSAGDKRDTADSRTIVRSSEISHDVPIQAPEPTLSAWERSQDAYPKNQGETASSCNAVESSQRRIQGRPDRTPISYRPRPRCQARKTKVNANVSGSCSKEECRKGDSNPHVRNGH